MIPDADRSGAARPLAEPARRREQRRLETSPVYPAGRKALHRYRGSSNVGHNFTSLEIKMVRKNSDRLHKIELY